MLRAESYVSRASLPRQLEGLYGGAIATKNSAQLLYVLLITKQNTVHQSVYTRFIESVYTKPNDLLLNTCVRLMQFFQVSTKQTTFPSLANRGFWTQIAYYDVI